MMKQDPLGVTKLDARINPRQSSKEMLILNVLHFFV